MTAPQQRRGSHHAVWVLGLAGSLLLTACGGSSGGSGASSAQRAGCETFDCQGMLENLASNVILPTYVEFEAKAASLDTSLREYCDALATSDEQTKLEAAQTSWKEAMGVWQHAEVMQLGPLLQNSRSLRNKIYSWPQTSACGVDQSVVLAEGGSYDVNSRTPDRRGLDAIEYLLFDTDITHSCPGTVVETQSWNSRDEAERKAARCNYATLLVQDLSEQAQTLLDQWDGTTDDFLVELTQPGMPGSRFATATAAVNAVSDALFYVEKQTKDEKLAKPIGIKDNSCGSAGTPCPAAVESPYSAVSKENIHNNLVAFQRLFLGNGPDSPEDRLGFDNYLSAMGSDNTSAVMETDIAAALDALSATKMPNSLAQTIDDDIDAAKAAHAGVKAVTDRLKNEFLSVQALTIPGSAAGDGD